MRKLLEIDWSHLSKNQPALQKEMFSGFIPLDKKASGTTREPITESSHSSNIIPTDFGDKERLPDLGERMGAGELVALIAG